MFSCAGVTFDSIGKYFFLLNIKVLYLQQLSISFCVLLYGIFWKLVTCNLALFVLSE